MGVASFLAREIKGLILGEAADPVLVKTVEELAAAEPTVELVRFYVHPDHHGPQCAAARPGLPARRRHAAAPGPNRPSPR